MGMRVIIAPGDAEPVATVRSEAVRARAGCGWGPPCRARRSACPRRGQGPARLLQPRSPLPRALQTRGRRAAMAARNLAVAEGDDAAGEAAEHEISPQTRGGRGTIERYGGGRGAGADLADRGAGAARAGEAGQGRPAKASAAPPRPTKETGEEPAKAERKRGPPGPQLAKGKLPSALRLDASSAARGEFHVHTTPASEYATATGTYQASSQEFPSPDQGSRQADRLLFWVARRPGSLRWTEVALDNGDNAKDALDRINCPRKCSTVSRKPQCRCPRWSSRTSRSAVKPTIAPNWWRCSGDEPQAASPSRALAQMIARDGDACGMASATSASRLSLSLHCRWPEARGRFLLQAAGLVELARAPARLGFPSPCGGGVGGRGSRHSVRTGSTAPESNGSRPPPRPSPQERGEEESLGKRLASIPSALRCKSPRVRLTESGKGFQCAPISTRKFNTLNTTRPWTRPDAHRHAESFEMKTAFYGFALAVLSIHPALATDLDCVSTTFNLLSPNDKVCVSVFEDPKVPGVACHISQARKGGGVSRSV